MEMSIMKKVICLITAVMLCVALASFAFAADEFVPSISYKGAPTIVEITDDQGKPAIGTITNGSGDVVGHLYADCLLITSIADANTSTNIPSDAKATLLSVYEQLNKGTMKLPYGKDVDAGKMVIKDLFDVSWQCEEHPAAVEPKGVTVTLTFDMGVAADADVSVMTYKNGAWADIVSVKNNGDGTVTCVFEDFCPVAVSVPVPGTGPDDTGDKADITLWVTLLSVSAVAVVALVVLRRRNFAK